MKMWSRAVCVDTAVWTGREIWVSLKTGPVESLFTQLQIIKHVKSHKIYVHGILPTVIAVLSASVVFVGGGCVYLSVS